MAEATKACSLTEDEIECLMGYHGRSLDNRSAVREDKSDVIERINYLNKRLKAFKEPEEVKTETKPAVAGWGTPAKE